MKWAEAVIVLTRSSSGAVRLESQMRTGLFPQFDAGILSEIHRDASFPHNSQIVLPFAAIRGLRYGKLCQKDKIKYTEKIFA